MLKKTILFLCCFILALPLMAGAKKEMEMPIPENSQIVVGVDIQAMLRGELAGSSLDELVSMVSEGEFENFDEANAKVMEEVGFTLNDVKSVYIFMPEFNLEGSPDAGFIINVKKMDKELLKNKIMDEGNSDKLVYKDYEYFKDGDRESFCFLETQILFGSNPKVLEAMLDVLDGAGDIKKNPQIGKMIKVYEGFMVYALGILPPELSMGLQDFLPGVELVDFQLGLNTTDSVELKLAATCSSADGAVNVATSLQLLLGMAGQMIPIDDPAISELIMKVIEPIEINSEGNQVIISLVYSKELIAELQEAAPGMMGLLGGGMY